MTEVRSDVTEAGGGVTEAGGGVTKTAEPAIAPGSLRAWVLAARPATLSAAVVPVVVGCACAVKLGGFALGPALAALAGAMWIQIGTNFANDVFDFEKGADTEERLGPVRAAQAGLLSASQLRVGMVVSFAMATACGLYLTWVAGPAIVVIGIASILSGIAYTGGPYPLGYNGLGDVFVMIFFGFVAVCGTVFVQMHDVPLLAWLSAIPVGALATAILVVNNVRDAEQDVRVGKRTLAVRFGKRFGFLEYDALWLMSYAVPVFIWAKRMASPWVLLPLLTLPIAFRLSRKLRALHGEALNPVLASTAKLLLLFGALFSLGLVVGQ